MNIKEQLHTLTPYQPGKSMDEVKRELGLEKIIKLASNENPYGCSKAVNEAVIKQMEKASTYPDGYATNVRKALANHLKVDEKQLIFGNGSDEVIQMVCRSLLYSGKNTVMATPTFPQYKHNATIEGAEVREIPLDLDGNHNLEEMLNAIDENTAVVWLCSPNNPTGTYISKNQLEAFMNQVPSNTLVVIDEAYCEYATAADYPKTIELLNTYNNVLITRTFSKVYGLASFRIGYGIGNQAFINMIEPVREPFNGNAFAQVAATAAIGDQSFIEDCVEKNKEGLSLFYTFCNEKNLHYFPSEGNFILIDVKEDSDIVFHYLLKHGYIVRSGKALGFPTHLRITIGTKEQNDEIISILSDYFAQRAANY